VDRCDSEPIRVIWSECDGLTIDHYQAFIGLDVSSNDPDKRGFAGPILSDQGVDLVASNLQADKL
jgi:hypothetical protein